MRGWLKWAAVVVVAQTWASCGEGFLVKHRFALGDFEEDGTGRRTRTARRATLGARPIGRCFIELSPPHGDLTFSGASYGSELGSRR